MEDVTQRSKSLNKRSNDWKKSLAVALIVAIFTSFANYMIWRSQVGERLLNTKISLLEKVTEDVTRYRYLRAFKVRMMITQSKYLYKHYQKNPKLVVIDMKQSAEIQEELKKLYPFEYEKTLECEEFHPEMMSKLVLVQLYFGDDVRKSVDTLITEFSDTIISKYIDEYFKSNEGINTIEQINELEIIQRYNKQTERILSSLINKMAHEIW